MGRVSQKSANGTLIETDVRLLWLYYSKPKMTADSTTPRDLSPPIFECLYSSKREKNLYTPSKMLQLLVLQTFEVEHVFLATIIVNCRY